MPIIYSLRRRIKELYEKKSEVKCIMWQHELCQFNLCFLSTHSYQEVLYPTLPLMILTNIADRDW